MRLGAHKYRGRVGQAVAGSARGGCSAKSLGWFVAVGEGLLPITVFGVFVLVTALPLLRSINN